MSYLDYLEGESEYLYSIDSSPLVVSVCFYD